MAPSPISSVLRVTLTVTLVLAGAIILFLMYHTSVQYPKCNPPLANSWRPNNTAVKQQMDKPVVLLWFWPENKHFDLQDCKKLFNIDSCRLTDDRSLYSVAEAVVIFHRAIHEDLSNLPASLRPRFQRWIWFNIDPPTDTRRIAGIQGLFNLTLSYRKDADIHVRWKVNIREESAEDFVIPKKQHLLCWIVNKHDLNAGSGERYRFYTELVKYIKVHVFFSASGETLRPDSYFQTISSCKFFLSFEHSIHRDYITEIFTGPLAAGTVPVVLGPPRENYEDFAPGSSFIHVNDFPDAMTLADFLLRLDEDNQTYIKYFDWRRSYTVRRHPTEERHKFAHAICQACHHVGMNKEYRVLLDPYKWFLL